LLPHTGNLPLDAAARACGVSCETIRRRLRTGRLPGAFRDGPAGAWQIPVSDLVAAGFEVTVRTETSGNAATNLELAELKAEMARARAEAAERLERIRVLEANLEDLRAALAREVAR
jgi:uncharacterized protein YlxW (UPF0749 family)